MVLALSLALHYPTPIPHASHTTWRKKSLEIWMKRSKIMAKEEVACLPIILKNTQQTLAHWSLFTNKQLCSYLRKFCVWHCMLYIVMCLEVASMYFVVETCTSSAYFIVKRKSPGLKNCMDNWIQFRYMIDNWMCTFWGWVRIS